ncbi:thiamine phosphate synthase [Paludibacter sp.]|uniref:thiamine phosphate synthase n=1 Tax=Paludibacter sp. TaxID=1898105 RepID=UPI001355064D|nr:thiamine phosphate synthase [Paludibacter sp.]MTK54054.1 thiamine phosphate synthase [Paludibacter sp.]
MIAISQPGFFEGEATRINALFAEGLPCLHLRKPDATKVEMEKLLSKIENRFHSRIMLHSHFELATVFSVRGLHFNERNKEMIGHYVDYCGTKSTTAHEIAALDHIPAGIDYVLFSPLFPSVSKQGYSREWDMELLRKALQKPRNFQIVALGGITQERISEVEALGFDDYAMLGSVWQALPPTTKGE